MLAEGAAETYHRHSSESGSISLYHCIYEMLFSSQKWSQFVMSRRTVVPMVTEATSEGLTLACSNMETRALLMPKLGFVVVGALCLGFTSA